MNLTRTIRMTPEALLELSALQKVTPGGFNFSAFVRKALAVAASDRQLGLSDSVSGAGSREFRLLDVDTQETICDLVARWDSGEAIHPDDISILDFRVDMGFPRQRAISRARRGPLDTVLSGSQWEDDEPPSRDQDEQLAANPYLPEDIP